jgi:hypothetical protein
MSTSHYILDGDLYFVEFHKFEDGSVQIEGVWSVDDEFTEDLGIPVYLTPEWESVLINQIQMEDR